MCVLTYCPVRLSALPLSDMCLSFDVILGAQLSFANLHPCSSYRLSVSLLGYCAIDQKGLARLCSSGARSPQATNIWSRATEKEKRWPVRALRFRLLWKPETKRANDLKRNGTKRKKLPRAPALLFARKTKALIAQCNSISCVIHILDVRLACFASLVSLPVY